MIVSAPSSLDMQVRRAHEEGDEAAAIAVMRRTSVGPQMLESAILEDARCRMERELPISVRDYLDIVELHGGDRVCVDAALNAALIYLVEILGCEIDNAVDVLESIAPERADEIHTAALLCELDGSIRQKRTRYPDLPYEIGPLLTDGRRRYELQRRLGKGAQGEVFEAYDRLLADGDSAVRVAVKVIGTLRDEGNLLQEARHARSVCHTNIVPLLDVTQADDDVILAYELIDGKPLDDWVHDKPDALSPRQAVAVVLPIADAMQAAHASRIVHLDLKPSNIIIPADGIPRVTDFGLARVRGEAARNYSECGALAFIPPEQYKNGVATASLRMDVYALGGIVAWLITGMLPNGDDIVRAIHFLDADAELPRPEVRERLRSRCDDTLVAIIERAMHPNADKRYQSVEAFAADLRRWIEARPIRWQRPSAARRALLFVKRRPVTAIATLVGAATILVMTATTARLGAARQRDQMVHELAMAEERATSQAARLEEVRRRVQLMVNFVRSSNDMRPSADWLTTVTVLESLTGPTVFGTAVDGGTLWDDRVSIVSELVAEARARGEGDTLSARLWENALGLWLYRADRFEEAVSVLDRSIAWLQRTAGAADPWTQMTTTIRDCATVRLGTPEAPAARARLAVVPADIPPWVSDAVATTLAGTGE